MDLKAIIGVALYYLIIALAFNFGINNIGDATTTAQPLEYTGNTTAESTEPEANFFSQLGNTISTFGKTLAFMFFAIGLPPSMPEFLQVIFHGIFIVITIICGVILKNAIWTGGG